MIALELETANAAGAEVETFSVVLVQGPGHQTGIIARGIATILQAMAYGTFVVHVFGTLVLIAAGSIGM